MSEKHYNELRVLVEYFGNSDIYPEGKYRVEWFHDGTHKDSESFTFSTDEEGGIFETYAVIVDFVRGLRARYHAEKNFTVMWR